MHTQLGSGNVGGGQLTMHVQTQAVGSTYIGGKQGINGSQPHMHIVESINI